jgi:hypothetical protein
MQLRALMLPIALLVSAPVLAQDAAKGGAIDVPDFRGVAVSHGIRAEVKPGTKSVRLEGGGEELARVKVVVKDGVLRTEVERNSTFFSQGLKGVRLYVTSPRVESVTASGGSHVDAQATKADSFKVASSGGGEITIKGVDSKELEAAVSGGGQLRLEGRADRLEVQASGGSIIEARKLSVESLEVQASGGSRVEARPSKSLTGELSGGSMVKAARKPERAEVNTSGGSQVQYE